ncbi:MAG TPA: GTP 3',8-cyclase MoaA [Humisphaera sp.]|jgi:cyclic pyranopterin phosphate synthase|nr:GTP 3',8-cyclase MoaA [Humisphaera sp.]
MRLSVVESRPASPTGFETGPRSIAAVRVLRISITDRCNYRCLYCMPEQGVRWLPREDILSFEEICQIVRAAIEVHGIRRFKLTGGEPTVRHGLVDLVAMLRRIDGIEDLSLTTNGQRLVELADPLYQAGLDRVTISLDSLQPEKFRRITRTGDLAAVLRGLQRCEDVGFRSIKINCVTMRGTNDDELTDFAAMSIDRPVTVRFIEYMPLGDAALLRPIAGQRIDETEIGPAGGCGAQDRGADSLIPEGEVRQIIENKLGPLVPVDRASESGVGPANVYQLAQGNPRGRIGFISAMSAPFCATCNRLRLTANGLLRSCLFEGGEVDVRPILRSSSDRPATEQALAQAMTDCVRLKPEVHSHHGNQQMSRIGG